MSDLGAVISGALRAAGSMRSPVPEDERESIAWAAAGEAWAVFPGGDPGGFAATVARRRVIDETRKVHGYRGQHQVFPRSSVPDRLVVDDPVPPSVALGLSGRDAALIEWLLEGYPYAWMGEQLGVTESRVSQLFREMSERVDRADLAA